MPDYLTLEGSVGFFAFRPPFLDKNSTLANFALIVRERNRAPHQGPFPISYHTGGFAVVSGWFRLVTVSCSTRRGTGFRRGAYGLVYLTTSAWFSLIAQPALHTHWSCSVTFSFGLPGSTGTVRLTSHTYIIVIIIIIIFDILLFPSCILVLLSESVSTWSVRPRS